MKAGWRTATLADTCNMYQPKTISAKEMIAEGPYPVFGANGIIGRYDQFNHEEPQLLITCRGATCGSVNISLPKSWVTGNAMVVRPKSADLEFRYLEYYFRGGIDLAKAITGAAQPQITRANLEPLKISFPTSIKEQRKIVAVLDKAFAAIASATANAKKNLANAQELFENSTSALLNGGEWQANSLGDVCAISSMLVDPRLPEFIDLPHVGAGNMESRTGAINEVMTAREEKLISAKFLFDASTVLYSKIRPYLMKACRPKFAGLCSADVYPLTTVTDKLDRDFLFHVLMSREFTTYAEAGSARSGMPKVNRDHLFAYQIRLPAVEIQRVIADRIDAIADGCSQVSSFQEAKLSALANLKQSLLQRAFTGKLIAAMPETIAA